MIILSCENIKISFGTNVVISDLTFAVNQGDKVGIVGVNGAGKSTLMKAINGDIQPDEGNIYISKNTKIGMLSQTEELDAENSVYSEMLLTFSELAEREEQIEIMRKALEKGDKSVSISKYTEEEESFLHDGGYEYKSRVKGILKNTGFAEEDFERKISTLSGGQKTRLSLVRLLLREPDILMLDEPTNHLDVQTLEWLEEYLSKYKKTIIVISHDRYFLDKVTGKILDLENRRGKLYDGSYSVFTEKKKKDREIEERHYKNQQREIARIEAYIEQQRRWNRERNIIAAESRQKMLDKMVKLEKPKDAPENVKIAFKAALRSGEEVLKIRDLSKSFGKKTLFSNISFDIFSGQRVFIIGKNGSGKSTLMKIIAGLAGNYQGRYEFGYNVKLGYYDQENQQLDPDNTVLDELWDCYPGLTQNEIRNTLALFLFKGDDISKRIGVLSGGEKARLTIAKLILSRVNLLLLDEPTNHLDINSREVLEEALQKFEGTVIAVSHDRYFIKKLSSRIIDFLPDEIADYDGNYEEYLLYKNSKNVSRPAEKDEDIDSCSKSEYLKNKKQNSEKRKYEKKIREAIEEVEKIEKRLEKIKEEEEIYSTDHVRLSELWEEKEREENRLLELYEFTDI